MGKQLLSALNAFQGLFLMFNKKQELTEYAPEKNVSYFLDSFSGSPGGKSLVQLFPHQISSQFSQGFKKLQQGSKSVEFDFLSSESSKHVKHIKSVLSVVDEKDGGGYLATLTEISEKKIDQDEYVQFEQYLLQTLMKNHPDSIYFKNTDSQFTRINHACAKKFNLTQHSEAIGKTDFDFFRFEHANNAYKDEQEIIKTGEPIVAKEEKEVYPGLDDKKSERWVTTTKLPLYDKNNEIIGTFGISRDITDYKKAEEKLKELNQELTELNRYKDKLFSVIAHDLRNPVAGLVGLMDIIYDEFESLPNEDLFEYLTTLRKNSKNTYELLEDLLQWARSQYEQLTIEPTLLNVTDTTNEVINNLTNQAEEKDISLQNEINRSLSVEADHNMVKTILRNLVSNAIKFSSAGDSIKIEAGNRQNEVWISVIDEGEGIKEEDQSKILTKSVTHTTMGTNGEKGSGLGLDLCLDFVKKHGGKLQLDSDPGKGSTFTVILPEKQNNQEIKVNSH